MISPSFQPLAEQERARELFLRREGLKIDAYAGTGKTTTLHLLAASTRERGLYLASTAASPMRHGCDFLRR